jgi:hypothetical protein
VQRSGTRSLAPAGAPAAALAGQWRSGGDLDVDEIVDDGQVRVIGRQEWHAVDVGGCRDHQVDSASAWLPAALGNRSGKTTPFAGDRSVDRQWIKRRLDHAEPLGPRRSLVTINGDQRPEMQFGK